MATTRLGIYNGALLICGERRLNSLTEDREPRYLLDDVWNNGGVKYCLEQGQWRFALRSVMLDYDPSVDSDFGFTRVFQKPTDWVNTAAVCSDEYFRVPLLNYQDEGGYIYADLDTIYARFVSNHDSFGMDFSKWPESFREFVEAHFAAKIIRKLTSDEAKLANLLGTDGSGLKNGWLATTRKIAKNKNAALDPTKFSSIGTWNSARRGGRRGGPMGDGGAPGSLT